MTSPLPCPFCGDQPLVEPTDPKTQGDAWGQVRCANPLCAANPTVGANPEEIASTNSAEPYKLLAILRWNRRAPISSCPPRISSAKRARLLRVEYVRAYGHRSDNILVEEMRDLGLYSVHSPRCDLYRSIAGIRHLLRTKPPPPPDLTTLSASPYPSNPEDGPKRITRISLPG